VESSADIPIEKHAAASVDYAAIARKIRSLARGFGFQRCGISDIDLGADEAHLRDWLEQGLYGTMDWMARHGDKRSRPHELLPGTVRVISVGLDYARDGTEAWSTLADGERAYVARYALGRDYHKMMRQRLQALADRIAVEVGQFGHRVFVDSAPVLERALARNAGLGWIGKHTCLIDKDGGSLNLPVPHLQPLPTTPYRPPETASMRARSSTSDAPVSNPRCGARNCRVDVARTAAPGT
jgi:epoxyqueuosine reductase